MCGCLSHEPPTGDLVRNPGMCPDWESNQQPLASQGITQSTEPQQPGPTCIFLNSMVKSLLSLYPTSWQQLTLRTTFSLKHSLHVASRTHFPQFSWLSLSLIPWCGYVSSPQLLYLLEWPTSQQSWFLYCHNLIL